MELSFDTLIDPQAVCLWVEAETPDQVITQLAGILERTGYVAPSYGAAVLAREAVLPTGLPLSDDFAVAVAVAVAVPHTDPHHVLKPGIAIATLVNPVPFRSMEDPDEILPVRIVFALALNDKNAQIEMLQSVALLFQTPELLMRMAAAMSPDKVLEVLRKIEQRA